MFRRGLSATASRSHGEPAAQLIYFGGMVLVRPRLPFLVLTRQPNLAGESATRLFAGVAVADRTIETV